MQVALYRDTPPEANADESQRVGRLSFVDLAGSERANRTGNVGARLKYVLGKDCNSCSYHVDTPGNNALHYIVLTCVMLLEKRYMICVGVCLR